MMVWEEAGLLQCAWVQLLRGFHGRQCSRAHCGGTLVSATNPNTLQARSDDQEPEYQQGGSSGWSR